MSSCPNGIAAAAAQMDQDYEALQSRYNDGGINRAQFNYYYTHPRYLHSVYELSSWYWRCVSVLKYKGQAIRLPQRPSDRPTLAAGGAMVGEEPTLALRLDNLKFHFCDRQLAAIRRDLASLDRDRRLLAEDVMREATFCQWSEVVTAPDLLLQAALERHLAAGARVAVYGSLVPVAETLCLDRGCAVPVVSTGVVTPESASSSLRARPTDRVCDEGRFDAVVVTPTLATLGLGLWGEAVREELDLLTLRALGRWLGDHGLLFVTVPVGEDRTIANLGRVYGERRLVRLLEGFDVVDDVAATGERGCAYGPEYRTFVLKPWRDMISTSPKPP